MIYKRRELRRLWEIEVYEGDPEDPETTTRKDTIIAWNQVDATRRAGGPIAHPPKAMFFVTWPDIDGNVYRIDSTDEGPIGMPLNPSVATIEPSEEDWKW